MPFKNEETRREYMRQYQRQRRAGGTGSITPARKTLNPEDIQTAQGLLDLLSNVIGEIRDTKADPFIRARCVGYLVSIALRAVEVADLEGRIASLEEQAEGGEKH